MRCGVTWRTVDMQEVVWRWTVDVEWTAGLWLDRKSGPMRCGVASGVLAAGEVVWRWIGEVWSG